MARNLVEVLLVSLWPDDVDNFMEGCARILFTILGCQVAENAVI